MKTTLALLMCLLLLLPRSWGQMVVEAPTLEIISSNQTGIMGTMSATMAAIEKAEQRVEALKKMASWIEQLESMQEFIQLLETTSCMAKDLNTNLDLSYELVGARSGCFNKLQYKIHINKLRYVVDVINVVLTDGFSMSRSGRLEAYKNALTAFGEAQVGLGKLSISLKRIIRRYERARDYRRQLLEANSF